MHCSLVFFCRCLRAVSKALVKDYVAMTKDTGHAVLMTDATRERLDGHADVERVGELDIRGREQACVVWSLRVDEL